MATTLYVGSIGHEDCDALATVVATTPEAVQAELERIEADELTDYRNSECDEDCGEDDCEHLERFSMWTAGPMPEGAMWVMRNVLGFKAGGPWHQSISAQHDR